MCLSLGWAFWFLVKCKANFSILEGLSFYFSSLLKVFLIFVKDFSYFSVARTNFMASVWYWCISLYMDCSVTLRLVKCKSHFSVFDGITYYLSFFSNPFDFFETFNIFKVWGQFWLFGADAGWRTLPHISTGYHTRHQLCYHVFKRVLYRFQRTTIISSLLHRSLYALRVIINFF